MATLIKYVLSKKRFQLAYYTDFPLGNACSKKYATRKQLISSNKKWHLLGTRYLKKNDFIDRVIHILKIWHLLGTRYLNKYYFRDRVTHVLTSYQGTVNAENMFVSYFFFPSGGVHQRESNF